MGEIQERRSSSDFIESIFLPENEDFYRARVTDVLPQSESERIDSLIRKELTGILGRDPKAFNIDVSGLPDIYGMSGKTLIEFSEKIEEKGVKIWQIALEEPFTDDGVCPMKARGRYNRPFMVEEGSVFREAVDDLKNFGYCESWANIFPHVNLYHLKKLAEKYPDIFFVSQFQSLTVKSVPGVQFFSYGLGQSFTSQGNMDQFKRKDWEKHWGDKYNEEFKSPLRKVFLELDVQEDLGRVVVDLGCGRYPVSSQLSQKDRKILLVDISNKVKSLREGNFYPVVYDFNLIGKEKFRQTIKEKTGQDRVDTFILSDILNYAGDWKELLQAVKNLLKKGGLLIISNMSDQGYYSEMKGNAPKDNLELLDYLVALGFSVVKAGSSDQVMGKNDWGSRISKYSQAVFILRNQSS